MTLHIELGPEEEQALLECARLSGRDPVQYARQIIRDQIVNGLPETALEESTPSKPALEDVLDRGFLEYCARQDGADVPTIDEVRASLARIPGSLAEDIIADREDRF